MGCVVLLVLGLVALLYVYDVFAASALAQLRIFSAGYPIISHFLKSTQSLAGGFNLGGINATGQVEVLVAYNRGYRD